MRTLFNRSMVLLGIVLLSITVIAQKNKAAVAALPGDTANKTGSSKTPRPFHAIITPGATADSGLLHVYHQDDKYYFEIPDYVLNQDILIVARISRSGANLRSSRLGYSGDQVGENVIRFELGPGNKIFLRRVSFTELSKDSTQPMYTAVQHSNLQPIEAAFDIKAVSVNKQGWLIDMTDYINNDNNILFFHPLLKDQLRLGAIQADRSYIGQIKSYPTNVEVKTVKTYLKLGQTIAGLNITNPAKGESVTLELNTSILLLPRDPMRPRYADSRVGYFTQQHVDFDKDPQGIKNVYKIVRWRLEPKDEDREKYLRGELVEPKKPIVFYIDPATPEKWVPYLIKGINDWQVAFEQAGFKNAIIGKRAPTREEDPTWSIEDARFSAVVYKPSAIANASGPNVHDPRTGEILESHINWYHNVMKLLKRWYFIQASPNDPRARKPNFDDSLMGDLIRFVSSHEVGHALGLLHNFGSSAAYPVEKLRDKMWVKEHGHAPSIMDYARFNYVAQPGDGITGADLYPRINYYDKWAIEWGYKLISQAATPEEEVGILNDWILKKSTDKRYWFGAQRMPGSEEPRCQSEDLGDDAVKASYYGIQNLKYILPHLKEWTKKTDPPGEGYEGLKEMYLALLDQFETYMQHVRTNIGGTYETPKSVEQSGPVYEAVPYTRQKEGMEFINRQLFTTPGWLIDTTIMRLVNGDVLNRYEGLNCYELVGKVQKNLLSRLLSPQRLKTILNYPRYGGNRNYTVFELLADLRKGVWTELGTHKPIDICRRDLQKYYVALLGRSLESPNQNTVKVFQEMVPGLDYPDPTQNDISSIARAELVQLKEAIKTAIPLTKDKLSLYHLQDVLNRISIVLQRDKK